MKRVALFIAAILLCAAPSAGAAGVYGSYFDGGDLGTGFGAGVSRHIDVLPIVTVEARMAWIRFTDSPITVDMFPIEAMGRVNFSNLYAGFGLGYYLLSAQSGSADNNAGGFAAIGVDVSPGPLGFFIEGRYLLLDTDTAFGHVDADGFGVNAGIELRL